MKPVARLVFDVIAPALLAIPLLGTAALQLALGSRWRALGSAERLRPVRQAAAAKDLASRADTSRAETRTRPR